MFERLICAPKSQLVPSSVLSTKRRMRKNICDLTRNFYKHITDIEDHDICSSRKIGDDFSGTSKRCKTFDKLEICSGKGREVPGVLPNIFFWTHKGTQSKSKVGLSRINSTEAEMVIGLTEYLVNCGVPKSSIAILTPYKGQLMLMRLRLINLNLLNNKDKENSVVLSTVDRFQGDEADIVIISLVIDAMSYTGFVKKLNRMIVLLSRARLGMYIIGNINYFEEKPDESTCHWTDILTKLRQSCKPDTNPSAILEKVEDLHYYGPRLGNELPICCPVHREKMVYYATSVQQLNLNFCKEKCSKLLSCEHSCDLLCHYKNKDDHNKHCSVVINPSPCETHAKNLTCHELSKNVRTSLPICYALKSYKCLKKVTVPLPCLHDCKIYCWEENEIAEGKRFYPECELLAHSPYVYPICCHELTVLCVVYHQYKKNPTLVKPCKRNVTHNPPCSHSVTVQCFLKQQYENGKEVFTCNYVLEKILPRCGHKGNINCDAFQTLNNWTGQSSELGVVYEGQSYGPADFICKEPIDFIYLCKHVTKMAWNLAFKNASKLNICHADVEIINPNCGHPAVIKCFQNQLLKNLPLKDPISEIKEGEISLQFNNHLQNHKCTFDILFHRRCGHNEKIQCYKVRGKDIQVCVVSVDINNPLCGHKLSLPCHLSDLND
ncbi:NFX1-type zinc finger-containing protein 1 homolog [Hydra vulgaris]|uniref:NFX1-type zinc finger-containing protein 1 homolog n=1 Tax=Hydra vulgaris TaxID=6087 RepID=A0ABM4CJJ0_HYDVU